MTDPIIVHKGRTTIVCAKINRDVSGDILSSEIRIAPDQSAALIATWTLTFLTDGTDGELVLALDHSVTSQITQSRGYMDIKRVVNGEPTPLFRRPLEVEFRGSVTA